VAVHQTAEAIEVDRGYQTTDRITNVRGACAARVSDFVLAKLVGFFARFYQPRSETGRNRFSRQLLSQVQTCRRTINLVGGTKIENMKMTTSIKQFNNRASFRLALPLIPLALACFALSPQARATCQQGCLLHANTALGEDALSRNQRQSNTAIGASALFANYTGSFNTAVGAAAMEENTTGYENVAVGLQALWNNRTGTQNVGIGDGTLFDNTNGDHNAALGDEAGSLLTGDYNIAIGADVWGVAGESNTIRIGKTPNQVRTFIAGISGVTVAGGVGVIVDTNGQLGTVVSSARYKDAIKPMDKASEATLALKPVTFRYKHDLDPNGIPQFGLVAEDVEKVNPDLVARDEQGKPYTVRYEAVNTMLLNEFLKEHKKVESLEKAMAEQQKDNAAMRAMLKEQAAQIQKVSARLEVTKTAPQTVANNR